MAQPRVLPDQRNPLILPEHTPALDILIERRRLGQTNLQVKSGHAAPSKLDAKDLFDYAHLRVPLPKDLNGSGIFSSKGAAYPESYFLMRRSSDGFISATGMFKAAFPWASQEDEEHERSYHNKLTSAGDEVAGNVWVSPEDALKLADDYAMKAWIVALLDPEPIEKGTKDKGSNEIATPPKFIVADKASLFPPAPTNMRTRSMRSASPSKSSSPRKLASPRKPRTTRKAAKEAREGTPSALHRSVENETPAASEYGGESVNGEPTSTTAASETVRVEVDETTQKQGEVETTTTAVKVDVPADHPELPLPESPEEMIAQARRMVEEANKAEGSKGASTSLKRKADDAELEEPEANAMEVQPVKRTKVLEEELRKERVRSKAFMGLSATLAIGALIPFLQSLL
ncbi:apses transcription factor-like protein [Phyllosticta citriasiana]|uniref:Apses transcription factor-like protein n=1 Tax=Phyllosticta citriasiana TaxID=595635 RepID=A0ABR1K9Z0_9PEZI